jgi:hypothetical protein
MIYFRSKNTSFDIVGVKLKIIMNYDTKKKYFLFFLNWRSNYKL